jgi:hypothetical protein
MKCPVCESKGERSQVDHLGTFSTLMDGRAYYDEDGVYHYDDPNTYTTQFRCSRGHRFSEERSPRGLTVSVGTET